VPRATGLPVVPVLCCLAPRLAAACRAALFSLCVVCIQAKLPLLHAACYLVVALADRLKRFASCRAGQGTCLFVCEVRAHICMAAERWSKFFCHSMASSSVCFMRFKYMFHLNVSCVLSGYCICCNSYTRMLQMYVSNVSSNSNVYCKCFIWMLHILQWLYTYVANVCYKCFI
jgi:hypothetical protein